MPSDAGDAMEAAQDRRRLRLDPEVERGNTRAGFISLVARPAGGCRLGFKKSSSAPRRTLKAILMLGSCHGHTWASEENTLTRRHAKLKGPRRSSPRIAIPPSLQGRGHGPGCTGRKGTVQGPTNCALIDPDNLQMGYKFACTLVSGSTMPMALQHSGVVPAVIPDLLQDDRNDLQTLPARKRDDPCFHATAVAGGAAGRGVMVVGRRRAKDRNGVATVPSPAPPTGPLQQHEAASLPYHKVDSLAYSLGGV